MNTITVRNLPPAVVKAVKEKARREKLSLNGTIVKLLEEATRAVAPKGKVIHHDLDHLAGTWSDAEYREFMSTLREARPDPELGK